MGKDWDGTGQERKNLKTYKKIIEWLKLICKGEQAKQLSFLQQNQNLPSTIKLINYQWFI